MEILVCRDLVKSQFHKFCGNCKISSSPMKKKNMGTAKNHENSQQAGGGGESYKQKRVGSPNVLKHEGKVRKGGARCWQQRVAGPFLPPIPH